MVFSWKLAWNMQKLAKMKFSIKIHKPINENIIVDSSIWIIARNIKVLENKDFGTRQSNFMLNYIFVQ